jgi:hypothetical protein
MGLRDWLRHPIRCLGCAIFGRLHADCPIPYVITGNAREALSRAAITPVRPVGPVSRGPDHGRHRRLADQRPGGSYLA